MSVDAPAQVAATNGFRPGETLRQGLGHGTLPLKLGAIFLLGAIAGLVYGLVALWLKVPAAQEMTGLALI